MNVLWLVVTNLNYKFQKTIKIMNQDLYVGSQLHYFLDAVTLYITKHKHGVMDASRAMMSRATFIRTFT